MKQILIVDHDQSFTHRLRGLLADESLKCAFIERGEEALDLLKSTRFDLIIISAELKGLNGYLLCKQIKENTLFTSIPLVIVSSAPDARSTFEKHRSLKFHADAYLEKKSPDEFFIRLCEQFIPLEKREVKKNREAFDIEKELEKQKAINDLLLKELNEYREECNFLRKKVVRVDEQLDVYSPKRSIMRFRDRFKSHDEALLELEKKDREIQNHFDTITALRKEIEEQKDSFTRELKEETKKHAEEIKEREKKYDKAVRESNDLLKKIEEAHEAYTKSSATYCEEIQELIRKRL